MFAIIDFYRKILYKKKQRNIINISYIKKQIPLQRYIDLRTQIKIKRQEQRQERKQRQRRRVKLILVSLSVSKEMYLLIPKHIRNSKHV